MIYSILTPLLSHAFTMALMMALACPAAPESPHLAKEFLVAQKAPKLPRPQSSGQHSQTSEPDSRPPTPPQPTPNTISKELLKRPELHPPELTIDLNAPASRIDDLAFSPDGRELAVVSDRLVRIYDVASGALTSSIRGDRSRESYGTVNAAIFSPDGKHLLVGITDDHPRGNIRLYDRSNYSKLVRLIPGLTTACRHLAFSPQGNHLVGADINGELVVFDWSTAAANQAPRVTFRLPMETSDSRIVDKIAFSEHNDIFFAITSTYVRICSANSGEDITTGNSLPTRLNQWLDGLYTGQYEFKPQAKVTPRITDFNMGQGNWVVSSPVRGTSGTDHVVGFYSRFSSQNGSRFPDTQYAKHRWEVTAVATSPDGGVVASGDRLGEVHLWDSKTGEVRQRIQSLGRPIYNAEYDADSKRVGFTWREDLDGWGLNHYGLIDHIVDLQAKSLRPIDNLKDFSGSKELVASPSGKLSLAKKSGSERTLIKLTQNQRVLGDYTVRSGNIVTALTMLPETREETMGTDIPVLYGDSDGRVICWDGRTSKLRRGFRGHEGMITAISVPSHNRFFVTSSVDKTIRFWPTQNFKPTAFFDFEMEDDVVFQVPESGPAAKAGIQVKDKVISINGYSVQEFWEHLLAGRLQFLESEMAQLQIEREGSIRQIKCGLVRGFDYVEPILNLFITQDEDWVFWTPEGYYDCSPGADRFIGWHVNHGPEEPAEYFRADQFREKMYRPDIIQAILDQGIFQKAVASSTTRIPLHKLTDSDEFNKSRPPVVTWISPGQKTTGQNAPANSLAATDDRLEASAVITSGDEADITSVTLLVNGIPCDRLIPETKEQRKKFEVTQRVKLTPGRNKLVWLVENNHKSVSSPDENAQTIFLNSTELPSNVSALIVGVNSYKHLDSGIPPLQFAKNDAESIAKALESQIKGNLYQNIKAIVLTDTAATRQGILGSLDQLRNSTQPGDTVILYFSMHGFLDAQDRFYLAAHDTDLNDLRSTGVNWNDILQFLEEDISQRKRIVFMDTCHAGGISSSARSPLMSLTQSDVGAIFFASSSVSEKSHEDPKWNHGAFTYSVLEALKDKVADNEPDTGDGFLNKAELESYLRKRVHALTKGRQTPLAYSTAENAGFKVFESSAESSSPQ